jgi:hypothetical protein
VVSGGKFNDLLMSELSSRFLNITGRNISSEIFFDCLLSEQDLSKLLCTCRTMKQQILAWKIVLPIKSFKVKRFMNETMLNKMILYYSPLMYKISIPLDSMLLTVPFRFFAISNLFTFNLLEFDIDASVYDYVNWLPFISLQLCNLKSLSLSNSNPRSNASWYQNSICLDLISRLTNLENIKFFNICHLDDAAVANYSALIIIDFSILCHHLFAYNLH